LLPLVTIVQSGEAFQLEDRWEFSPFTFRAGHTVCQSPIRECNWIFLAQALEVDIDATPHSAIEPGHSTPLPVSFGAAQLEVRVLHSAFFVQTFEGEACAALYSPRQSFAFSVDDEM
jgi:hypothetical protein